MTIFLRTGLGDDTLRGHRANSDGGALQVEGCKQVWDILNLVTFLRAEHLPYAYRALIHPGTNQMHHMPALLGVVRAVQGLGDYGTCLPLKSPHLLV